MKLIINISALILGIGFLSCNAVFADQEDTQTTRASKHVRSGQAKALIAIEKAKYKDDDIKTVIVKITQLTDNKGQAYLAGKINKADITQYLEQLKMILGDKYDTFRQHQSARDHSQFHVTVVNPLEYQTLTDKDSLMNEKLRVQLHGLGRVSQGQHTSYFVVATSTDGEFLRQKILLKPKDFHITLGFKAKDVHGVAKNEKTLIKK